MSDPYIVSVVSGTGDRSYAIMLSNGDVIIIDGVYASNGNNYLSNADDADGTTDGQVDLADLVTEILAGNVNNGFAIFRSPSGVGFTVGPGFNAGGTRGDDYILNLDNGTSIIIDQKLLTALDTENGDANDSIINVDTLLDADSTDSVYGIVSSSGQNFTVETTDADDSFLITFDDGRVFSLYGRGPTLADALDGTSDGVLDVDLITASGSGWVNEFVSSSGQTFTVTSVNSGTSQQQLLIKLENGDTVVVDGNSGHGVFLDNADGTDDGKIDVDNLFVDNTYTTKAVFHSAAGDSFTVTSGSDFSNGGTGRDYIITFDDGRVIVADDKFIAALDRDDGTTDFVINVDDLFDSDSSDSIAEFFSTSGQAFEVSQGGEGDSHYLITLENGNVITINGVTLSNLDSEDGTNDGRVDIDALIDADSADNIVEFYSESGQSFTVEPGYQENDFTITLEDGSVILINGQRQGNNLTLSGLDGENSVVDGRIDVDALRDSTSTDNITTLVGGPVCFAGGTLIETPMGEVKVENLKQGDLVCTKDNGNKEIQWIGSNAVSGDVLAQNKNFQPIRIKAGALGSDMPERDLLVSPQHRVMVQSKIAKRMFESSNVLVAAKNLVMLDGIDVAHDVEEVTYYHFLFDQHEVVFSNGAQTESLFTGPEALKSISAEAHSEILALFPELADMNYQATPASTLAKGRMGRKLAVRHKNNQKPLFDAHLS